MKKTIPFITLLILFSLTGCGRQTDSTVADQTFYPLEECSEVTELAPYIDVVEILQVNGEAQPYTADIAKVLRDSNANFYLLDVRGKLTILNSDGTPSQRMIHQGRAANEYRQIDDIALTDDELMLLDGPTIKCFKLTNFQEVRTVTISPKAPFDAIAPYKDGGAYLFSAFPADYDDAKKEKDHLLYLIDNAGRSISEEIPREDCTFSIGNITQSYGNTYYLRPQNNKHIFYQLTPDGVVPKYRIDFKEKTIPDRYYFESAKEDIYAYMTSPFFKLPIYLHETATQLVFNAAGTDAVEHNFLYDKEHNKGIRWQTTKGDPTIRISASDKTSFYIFLPGFTPGSNEQPGPLVAYIQNQLKQSATNANDLFIIKLKFKDL